MLSNLSFRKYLAVNAAGFGLAGLLWGLILYRRLPNLEYPFHYAFVILLAVLGGASLALLRWNVKGILKSIGGGFLGYGVGVVIGIFLIYPLSLTGELLLVPVGYLIEIEKVNLFLNLEPDIAVGDFWLIFLVIGIFTGLFYALFLKTKVWPLIWRGGVGFALGSLIGPVIGNLLGNLFNSLLIAYLITFAVMSVVLGKFLARGAYKFKR